ncbi:MAG: universal stress protein [Rhodothermales bacterium]
MYQKLLIPVDLSDKNEITLKTVQQVADPQAGTITLLHVIETLQDVPFEEMKEFYQELKDRAERRLAIWMDTLGQRGFDVHSEIVFGKRGQEIIRCAEDEEVDLIVLRSHTLDRSQPGRSIGTLSHQVALLAPCSVLLIR